MAARAKSTRAVIVLVISLVGLLGTVRQVLGIPWPVAPQNSAHAINKTYGDWNGDRCWVDSTWDAAHNRWRYTTHIAYHTGVDIPADSGTAVLAVFDGYVKDIKHGSGDTCFISIARTLNGNPSWHYGHVIPCSALTESTFVSTADTLGFVAPFRPNPSNCHVHFYLEEEVGNLTRSVCNPLDSLAPAPSQSVEFDERSPHQGSHNYKIYYVPDLYEGIDQHLWDTTATEYLLRDSVDVIGKAYTTVQGMPTCGLHGVGYGVEPVHSGGSIPFRAMLVMRGLFEMTDSLAYCHTYADSVSYHFSNWYIVTNCGDSIPSVAKGISNIEENCWPTRVDTSGTGPATRNEEARFPDGRYDVFLKAWSHSGDTAAVVSVDIGWKLSELADQNTFRRILAPQDKRITYNSRRES